jgi:O-antigen/teichoic acid export membrane protein
MFGINYLFANKFAKNAINYASYFGLTFLIQLVFTPVIARVYTAESYGYFSLTSSIAAYLSVLYTLQLEQAVVLQKSELRSRNISKVVFTTIVIFFIITYFVIGAYQLFQFLIFDNVKNVPNSALLAPILAALIGFHAIYGAVANRFEQYKKILQFIPFVHFGSKLITVTWGMLFYKNFIGLLIGEISLRGGSTLIGFRYVINRRLSKYFGFLSISKLITILKENLSYLKFYFPFRIISVAVAQAPIFFFAYAYPQKNYLGYYAFACVFLEIPIKVFSYSIATVFMKNSFDALLDSKKLFVKTKKLILFLSFSGCLIYGFISLFAFQLFDFLFGSQWALSAKMAICLAPFFLFRFIFDSIQNLFLVLQLNRSQLIFNILSAILIFLLFYCCFIFSISILNILVIYSIGSIILILIQTVYLLIKLMHHDRNSSKVLLH